MDQSTAERIAMALEGIEEELKRGSDVAEAAFALNRKLIEEQQEARAEFERQVSSGILRPAAGPGRFPG